MGDTVDGHVPDTYEITTTWLNRGNEYSIAELRKFDKASSKKDPTSNCIPSKAGKNTVKLSAPIVCPLNILVPLLKSEVVDIPTAFRILRARSIALQCTETLSPVWKWLVGWGVEGSSVYYELQGYPSLIHPRQRARKQNARL